MSKAEASEWQKLELTWQQMEIGELLEEFADHSANYWKFGGADEQQMMNRCKRVILERFHLKRGWYP